MPADPIIYFDRYEGIPREEEIYRDGALRLAYETAMGRTFSWLLFSRPFLSRVFGWYMSRPASASRIRPFVEKYGLKAEEFAKPLGAYTSFNDFFRRELAPGYRPLDADPASVVFPADGRHFGWQEIGPGQGVYAKGQTWELPALLGGDIGLARRFAGGTLVVSRLCPVDYHHFHYPVGGRVLDRRLLDGRLYSVSPVALRRRLGYLWENRRFLTRIRTPGAGEACFLVIGATNVGSIRHRELPDDQVVERGAPSGWFEFGGSCVVTLFEPGRVRLASDLLETTRKGIELYAHVGDRMGSTWE
jgi:phosphatidylserine decarboxylase